MTTDDKKRTLADSVPTFSIPETTAEVYELGTNPPQPHSDDAIRQMQTPTEGSVTPGESASGELYAVYTGEDSTVPRGPDMRVLFTDEEIRDGEVYGVTLGESAARGATPPVEISKKNESAASAPQGGLYGVGTIEPRFFSSDVLKPGRLYTDPDEAIAEKGGKRKSIHGNADLEGAVSLELLYDRRQAKNRETMFDEPTDDEDESRVERTPIPPHPFVTGIFRPFINPGFLVRIMVLTVAALVVFYPGVAIFSRMVGDLSKVEKTEPVASAMPTANPRLMPEEPVLLADRLVESPKMELFLAALYGQRLILFFVGLLWGVFAIPYFLQVFTATAAGDDRLAEWPEMNFLGGIGLFLWMLLLVFLAGVPGWICLRPFGWAEWGFVGGVVLLTPVFFLSCLETDTLFTLITPKIAKSLWVVGGFWRQFYLISTVLFLFGGFGFIGLLWPVVWQTDENKAHLFSIALGASALFSILPVIYLRYLGRLAWVIQERFGRAAPSNKPSDGTGLTKRGGA